MTPDQARAVIDAAVKRVGLERARSLPSEVKSFEDLVIAAEIAHADAMKAVYDLCHEGPGNPAKGGSVLLYHPPQHKAEVDRLIVLIHKNGEAGICSAGDWNKGRSGNPGNVIAWVYWSDLSDFLQKSFPQGL